jgi:hypothetical protein
MSMMVENSGTFSASPTSIPSEQSLRFGTRLTNALTACILFDIFDDAIADLLCVRTCAHGTSPKCYHNIMKVGADPNCGNKGGETIFYEATGQKLFEQDREKLEEDQTGWDRRNRFFVCPHEAPLIVNRLLPRMYTFMCCYGENGDVKKSRLVKIFITIVSVFEGLCSPIIKFRFRSDNIIKFKFDKTFKESQIAAFTDQAIAADHIGLSGSLREGLNRELGSRIKQNPGQFCKGLVELILSVGLLALAIVRAFYCPPLGVAFIAYGAFTGLQVAGGFILPFCYKKTVNSGCNSSVPSRKNNDN